MLENVFQTLPVFEKEKLLFKAQGALRLATKSCSSKIASVSVAERSLLF